MDEAEKKRLTKRGWLPNRPTWETPKETPNAEEIWGLLQDAEA